MKSFLKDRNTTRKVNERGYGYGRTGVGGISDGVQKSASAAAGTPSKKSRVLHEGPMKFTSEISDLNKLIPRTAPPKPKEEEPRYLRRYMPKKNKTFVVPARKDGSVTSGLGKHLTSSPSYTLVKAQDNSSSQTFSTGDAKIPSLPPKNETINFPEEKLKMQGRAVDSNNNVLETFKNTVMGSLGIYKTPSTQIKSRESACRASSMTSNGNSDATTSFTLVVDYEKEKMNKTPEQHESKEGSLASKSKESVMSSEFNDDSAQGKSNDSLDRNNNSTYGIFMKGSDSVLIPAEIEEQLQRALQRDKISRKGSLLHHGNRHSPSGTRMVREDRSRSKTLCNPAPTTSINGNEPTSATKLASSWPKEETDEEEKGSVSGKSMSELVSRASSFASATTLTDDTDLETTEERSKKHKFLETQTSVTPLQDAETDRSESIMKLGAKHATKKRLLSMVMAVNTGIHIDSVVSPCDSSTSSNTDQKKKSVRIKGIMKEPRPSTADQTAHLHSDTDTIDTRKTSSLSALSKRKCWSKTRFCLDDAHYAQPGQFVQVGADYSFPAVSLSALIENIVGLTWASKNAEKRKHNGDTKDEKQCDVVIPMEEKFGGFNKEVGLMGTAYNMFTAAGLKLAKCFLSTEEDLAPREDMIRYNGYTIKVCGRKLLLESMHVNLDFNVNTPGIYGERTSSNLALRPRTISREKLEESCEGKRVRIVVRLNALLDDKLVQSIMHGEKHCIRMDDGKWTFIYGSLDEWKEKVENFVEITCPTGVHPASIAYGLLNGLLLVDAM